MTIQHNAAKPNFEMVRPRCIAIAWNLKARNVPFPALLRPYDDDTVLPLCRPAIHRRRSVDWTMSKPRYWDDAARELSRRDPVLRRLIRAHPGVHLKRRSDPFTTLARAIVGQQISVKAADSIWRRFVVLIDASASSGFP